MALTKEDLRFVVTRLPRDVRDLAKEHGLFIGGGFIREMIAGNKPNDVDLFGPTKEVLGLAAELIAEKRGARIHKTDNAITVLTGSRMPIQFITRWLYSDPHKLLAEFDFTVCQAVIWFDKEDGLWKSATAPTFYPDLAARRLVYTYPQREEDAGGSMLRVRKFLQRGYTIQAPSLGGVIARIARAVNWEKVGDDEQHVGRVIAGLLREVDPLTIVDGLEPIDDHESIND